MFFNSDIRKNKARLKRLIETARGKQKADLVIKNVHFLDIFEGKFILGDVAVSEGFIVGTKDSYEGTHEVDGTSYYLVPGFIDTHIHIESSLMTPFEFQKAVMPRGTTSVIWDPHEIANVKGKRGIRWAIKSTENLLLDIYIMLSSCVPATDPKLNFETSGAYLKARHLKRFQHHPRVLGLAEMMNYPGVMNCEEEIIEKFAYFKNFVCDGHCPGLRGKNLNAYLMPGIHTNHEATTLEEAKEQLEKGLCILIREGSCAKNAEALLPLLNDHTAPFLAFCTDDRKPNDILEEGHIDFIINKALKLGYPPELVFHAASFSSAQLYTISDIGAIAPAYKADFCLIKPKNHHWQQGFELLDVYKNGIKITKNIFDECHYKGTRYFKRKNIHVKSCRLKHFEILSEHHQQKVRVIGIQPEQLITDKLEATLPVINGKIPSDISQDILKIAVFERHKKTGFHSVGFVKGFGLKEGAIATSINHDSHNIIVVGANDKAMYQAVQRIIAIDGGIVVVDDHDNTLDLPLAIGGLMSDQSAEILADILHQLKNKTKEMGCALHEPFLQLSFLALPVIPSLKITDRGLVDVDQFKIVDVCI